MRISSRTAYALSVLGELDAAGSDCPVSTDGLAARAAVPRAYLELVLAGLRRARILRAVRGPGGGWRLARPASKISALDVYEALDGKLVIIEPGARARRTERLWTLLGKTVEKTLGSVSVRSLNAEPVRKRAKRRSKPARADSKPGRKVVGKMKKKGAKRLKKAA